MELLPDVEPRTPEKATDSPRQLQTYFAMKAVAQEHAMGCAVACVAARNGTSYQEALMLFAEPSHAWRRGYYCAEVVEALAMSGRRYDFFLYDPVLHSPILKVEGTIVFVGPCESYPAGHYLVRARQGWMNPWINFPWMLRVAEGFESELVAEPSYVLQERWGS